MEGPPFLALPRNRYKPPTLPRCADMRRQPMRAGSVGDWSWVQGWRCQPTFACRPRDKPFVGYREEAHHLENILSKLLKLHVLANFSRRRRGRFMGARSVLIARDKSRGEAWPGFTRGRQALATRSITPPAHSRDEARGRRNRPQGAAHRCLDQ
jgi:hypothetical protein